MFEWSRSTCWIHCVFNLIEKHLLAGHLSRTSHNESALSTCKGCLPHNAYIKAYHAHVGHFVPFPTKVFLGRFIKYSMSPTLACHPSKTSDSITRGENKVSRWVKASKGDVNHRFSIGNNPILKSGITVWTIYSVYVSQSALMMEVKSKSSHFVWLQSSLL